MMLERHEANQPRVISTLRDCVLVLSARSVGDVGPDNQLLKRLTVRAAVPRARTACPITQCGLMHSSTHLPEPLTTSRPEPVISQQFSQP